MSASPCLDIYSVLVAKMNGRSMHIPISLLSERTEKIVDTRALINSGAGGTFINQNFARRLNLPIKKLETPLIARNVDGTLNK